MISRFLLGAALGTVVGSGILALISVNFPMSAPVGAPVSPPAVADATPPVAQAPEDTPKPEAEAPPEAVVTPDAPEVIVQDEVSDPAVAIDLAALLGLAEQKPLPPLSPQEQTILDNIAQNQDPVLPSVEFKIIDPQPITPVSPPEVAAQEPLVVISDPAQKPSVDGSSFQRIPTFIEKDAAAAVQEAPAPQAEPPLKAFARPFDNEQNKPLYSVILIDDGAEDLDRAALARPGFAISFALDPMHPKASEHAQVYRDAGQEVIMLATGVVDGAQASDLETSFDAMSSALPQSVAVMDLASHRFQSNRPLASLVLPVIKEQGRGLVSWNQGLNAAEQVAIRDHVPSALVFRGLDFEDESQPVIRRYLDRAAFKAAQEGKVVVVGSTSPQTVATLMSWAVEGRAAMVALAPISAAMSKP